MSQNCFIQSQTKDVHTVDFLRVITLDLNALLPLAVQTVNGIDKIFAWNVEVDRSANFVLKVVPVLEDAATQKLLQSRKRAKSAIDSNSVKFKSVCFQLT